jgi:hypothetical protein
MARFRLAALWIAVKLFPTRNSDLNYDIHFN